VRWFRRQQGLYVGYAAQIAVFATGRVAAAGEVLLVTHPPYTSRVSRFESARKLAIVVGRNRSSVSNCVTGWYLASSLAGVAACAAPAAAIRAAKAMTAILQPRTR
jgi:hypothetical protein